MKRVVLALDSFKGSITARDAAQAIAAGWRRVDPSVDVVIRQMADGGEGTLTAVAEAVTGARRVPVRVRGPHGRLVDASWLLVGGEGGTGVVELASTSGIELLAGDLRPWDADTFGFGEAIASALDAGVNRLVLGLGSSASTDGGLGALIALGARAVDAEGDVVSAGLRGLTEVESVDLSRLRTVPPGGVVALTDVTNPLLGAAGAATVFGPQKGLDADGVRIAESALGRFAALLGADSQLAGTGAAGGAGFGLVSWGARLVSGATEVSELIGLPDAVAGADLVVTGEGSYDRQSAAGKVPSLVAGLARSASVPVALVSGRVAPDADTSGFDLALSLSDLAGGQAASLAEPARWLAAAGTELAIWASVSCGG